MSLVSDTQDLINDSGVFWPAQQIHDALNDSMLEVWQELELHLGTATATTAPGDEFITIPTTILTPKSITIGDRERYITSRILIERYNHEWKTSSLGDPQHWVVYDSETLMPFPRPNLAYIVVIRGVLYPTEEITGGNLDIAEDNKIKESIIWRASATLAEHTRPDLVQVWSHEAARAIREADKKLGRNLFGKYIKRIRPASRINVAHQGDVAFGRSLGTRTFV